ncbi:cytochrome c oxidase subunit 3 [Dyella sp.]|uniref:cytochrome c oxidase subunit 3 n=1 Tax=Dyella sp. TaxID=1869338 RepID=UPI002D77F7F1|nr:cytochrome c oxidase subunit 3 [Dyella sp.]HET7332379.1 cytochrome c oxidase subunit 3 [Dyella sp.]
MNATLPEAAVQQQFDDASQQKEAAMLGMWAFIATEVLFFGVLFAAYVVCRWRFPLAFVEGSAHTDFAMGTAETAILLTSGCLAAIALRQIQLDCARQSAILLMITSALGVAFLVLHGMEYHDEFEEGLIPGIRYTQTGPDARGVELFFSLYYVITGFHSLHVLIGVVLLLVMAIRTWRGTFSSAYYTPIEITGLYWSLVDIVWIFVYPAIYLVGSAG